MTTAAPTPPNLPPPPAPGERVASGVAPGDGTLYAAGGWFVKIASGQDGFTYTAHQPAESRQQTHEFADSDFPFTRLNRAFAMTGNTGLGVFVVEGENIRPANGLTPEQVTTMLIATSVDDPATSGLLWVLELGGSVSIEHGCGMVAVTDYDASTTTLYDAESGAAVASAPFVRLDALFCSGRQFVLGDIWVDLDTSATAYVADLLLYEASGRYVKGAGIVFDLVTGAVVFDIRAVVGGANQFVVDDTTGTVVLEKYELIGYDIATQTERWRIPGEIIDEANLELQSASDGVVRGYTGASLSPGRQLVALDALTGAQLWAGGKQDTVAGSDSRAVISAVRAGDYIALDFADAGVQIFAAGRALLGADFGTVVWR